MKLTIIIQWRSKNLSHIDCHYFSFTRMFVSKSTPLWLPSYLLFSIPLPLYVSLVFSLSLSLSLSVSLSLSFTLSLSLSLSLALILSRSACLPVCVSVCLSACLCVCVSVCLCICLSVYNQESGPSSHLNHLKQLHNWKQKNIPWHLNWAVSGKVLQGTCLWLRQAYKHLSYASQPGVVKGRKIRSGMIKAKRE